MSIQETEKAPKQPAMTTDADGVAKNIAKIAKKGPPPVHLWNPPYCGDLDIRISRDGLWWYLGTPIGREPLVRLFASVLRRDDDDRYYLVTPVEKIGIQVDDVPFVAVDFRRDDSGDLVFQTNVGDEAALGPDHPLRVEKDPDTGEPTPYILVRARLEARIDRKSFYRLVDIADAENGQFGLRSGGRFFPLATLEELGLQDRDVHEIGAERVG